MIRVALIGATGRMGRALLRAAPAFPQLRISAAIASPASAALNRDAGELAGAAANAVPVSADLADALSQADVAIDFSRPEATLTNLTACQRARKPLLVGTTGYDSELEGAFAAASREIPLLVAPNTSIAVAVLLELVRQAARALPEDFDIEIIEAHHRHKRDAPSGTALALGEAAAAGRGRALVPRTAGERAAPRTEGAAARAEETAPGAEGESGAPVQIGFAVVRGGDIVGDHTVLFAGTGERLALAHQATDRALFARGALRAAAWLAVRPPGRYFMRDLVSYKSVS